LIPHPKLIRRCHPLDGITNLKYKLFRFLTPNKTGIEAAI
jgi:hypothetical protein